MDAPLSHVGTDGSAKMVDVGGKSMTARRARATTLVVMKPETLQLACAGGGPKGPVIEVARIAGIQAAKRTAELVPLCHPLPLDVVEVSLSVEDDRRLRIEAVAATTGRTGVEMEALVAAAVTALTVIDMLKAVEKELVITNLQLEEKSGGRSGTWTRGTDGCAPS